LNDNKIALDTQVLRSDIGEVQSVSFTAKPQVVTGGTGVVLEDIQYVEGKELPPEFTQAIVNKVADILNLRSFDLEGMTLRIDSLQIEAGKLILNAQAHIVKIPA
ncbi:MAG: LmeA family phospholipid-binding protein, partial [Desertifilum sp. SIO1I2]|nr:LmeA family phospholipid-binding protein [Desertifilum sp. SIO1I2]